MIPNGAQVTIVPIPPGKTWADVSLPAGTTHCQDNGDGTVSCWCEPTSGIPCSTTPTIGGYSLTTLALVGGAALAAYFLFFRKKA